LESDSKHLGFFYDHREGSGFGRRRRLILPTCPRIIWNR